MDEWLKQNNILRYSTHGEHQSAVIERFNRTLKTNMWKTFTAENTRNWIDMINRLLKAPPFARSNSPKYLCRSVSNRWSKGASTSSL